MSQNKYIISKNIYIQEIKLINIFIFEEFQIQKFQKKIDELKNVPK